MLGLGGIDNLRARRIAERHLGQKETIAISESSASGLISAVLLSVPCASAYFLGGGVIHTRKAVGVRLDLTSDKLGRNQQPSRWRVCSRIPFGADWGLAETGATGPTGNRYGDAASHACLAVSGKRHLCFALTPL